MGLDTHQSSWPGSQDPTAEEKTPRRTLRDAPYHTAPMIDVDWYDMYIYIYVYEYNRIYICIYIYIYVCMYE